MTDKSELAGLFHYDKTNPRIVAYVAMCGIATSDEGEAVAISGRLLDPETKEPTERILMMQMLPPDAWSVVQAILNHAKKRGWNFPMGSVVEFPSDGGTPH